MSTGDTSGASRAIGFDAAGSHTQATSGVAKGVASGDSPSSNPAGAVLAGSENGDDNGGDGPHDGGGWRASPWLALVIVLFGSYAAALNVTVTGVALPDVAASLDTTSGPLSVDWVVTSYLVGVVVMQPATAWLADRWGRATIYVAGLSLFAVGSVVCTFAPEIFVLIGGRFVQGLGAGGIMPVGMTLIYELFPPRRRGTAMGVWGVGIAAAPAAGPPLGGWLVTATGWRSLFGLFIVVAGLGALLAVLLLRDSGFRERRHFDLLGWALTAASVVAIVVMSREATSIGLTSPIVITTVLAAAVVMIWLVRRSLRVRQPIIEFRMYATPAFSITMLVTALLAVAQYSRLNYLPVELNVVRGLDAQEVGLLLAPGAIGIATMMPFGGWLCDRIGARVPTTVGIFLVAASLWQLGHLQPDGSNGYLVLVLIAQGAGTGLAFVPTTVTAMNCLPGRFVAQASVVTNLTRQFAGAVGVAALGALLVSQMGAITPADLGPEAAQDGYNRMFQVAFWLMVGCLLAAMLMPGRKATRQQHADRESEIVQRPVGER